MRSDCYRGGSSETVTWSEDDVVGHMAKTIVGCSNRVGQGVVDGIVADTSFELCLLDGRWYTGGGWVGGRMVRRSKCLLEA